MDLGRVRVESEVCQDRHDDRSLGDQRDKSAMGAHFQQSRTSRPKARRISSAHRYLCGLRYWKDGRDVPDVMIGSYDYPKTDTHAAFNLQMRVNFIDGSGGSSMIRLVGTEGVLTIGFNSVKVQKSILPQAPGFGGWDSFGTFTEATQKDFEKKYNEEYAAIKPVMNEPEEVEYKAPRRYSDHYDHWATFIDAVQTNKTVTEDATFGLRAAAAALASNDSYFGNKIINWDPESMRVT